MQANSVTSAGVKRSLFCILQALNEKVSCGIFTKTLLPSMCSWLLRTTIGVIAMLQNNFFEARDVLQGVCKELEDMSLPSWLPHQAVAAVAWANHAAAIICEGTVNNHHETVLILAASLNKLPHYTLLHRQLATCLLLENQFPKAMCALHCALSF